MRPISDLRLLISGLCALLFALCVVAEGQETKKIPRVGYLTSTEPPYETFRKESIRQALRELGYIEGQNIAIEYRYAEGKMDRLPELAAELVRLNVNVIVAAGGDGVIRAANNASKTIPIVMTGQGSDPVESGLVKSLSRPGGSITGVTNLLVQLGDKRLELLKEAVPKIARVAVLYVPGDRTHGLELKEVQSAARALGVNIQTREVRGANDFDSVFTAMDKDRPDALHVLGGSLMRDNRKRIIGFASKRRLPSVYDTRRAVDAGGLMSYGADLVDSYRRVAWYVDKILKGAKPADLPVEQPRKFELAINLKTAKQIGLTIPPNVLARADRVIK
jgi:putative tryptophan/tyrosine transport system substrate-binding protein